TESVKHGAKLLRPDQLVAAAMLHTELGAAILGSLPSQTNVHLHHAQDLLDAMGTRRGEREHADAVRLRWYHFVISLYSTDARLGDADRYAREALGKFPHDPVLIVQKGTIVELSAAFNVPPPPSPTLGRGRAPDSATRQSRTLESAAAEYRRALELDPHLAVARLHLGWVHVLVGDNRARDDLAMALADANDDTVRYLAHLFLGGLAERQSRLDDAAKEYELAHEQGDRHQTPFVALSRVEAARGHADRARELARELAALERVDDDPWWDYHLGAIDQDALKWLRDEAHRR
ncbi:MAG TPA: hypothetical protein VGQ77_10835, partial [Methylomirabilota bacterium]|nr:hypothetical protein [Methylomirabilota bacterium]